LQKGDTWTYEVTNFVGGGNVAEFDRRDVTYEVLDPNSHDCMGWADVCVKLRGKSPKAELFEFHAIRGGSLGTARLDGSHAERAQQEYIRADMKPHDSWSFTFRAKGGGLLFKRVVGGEWGTYQMGSVAIPCLWLQVDVTSYQGTKAEEKYCVDPRIGANATYDSDGATDLGPFGHWRLKSATLHEATAAAQ
jgi:hypothetical protein